MSTKHQLMLETFPEAEDKSPLVVVSKVRATLPKLEDKPIVVPLSMSCIKLFVFKPWFKIPEALMVSFKIVDNLILKLKTETSSDTKYKLMLEILNLQDNDDN